MSAKEEDAVLIWMLLAVVVFGLIFYFVLMEVLL